MSFNASSHNTSGLRSPALASAMSFVGDSSFDSVVAASSPQSDADDFECDA
jgi:hypothetical protein